MLCSLVAFAVLVNGRLRRDGGLKMPSGAGAMPTVAAGAADTPPARKPNPKVEPAIPQALFCLKLDNSYCYARYILGNNCNVVVKLVQEYHFVFLKIHFTSVLRKQFAANDTFLREAVTSERSR